MKENNERDDISEVELAYKDMNIIVVIVRAFRFSARLPVVVVP